MPIMPVELGYFTLKVKDIGRAQKFYGALFGWELDISPMGAHVKNTKFPIGLERSAAGDFRFAYFKVQDIEAAVKQVAELGGAVRDRSESPSGLSAICADDQDTVFSLWQPAPGFE
jgi:predicted enzyme related to lactoylglutathione lyase